MYYIIENVWNKRNSIAGHSDIESFIKRFDEMNVYTQTSDSKVSEIAINDECCNYEFGNSGKDLYDFIRDYCKVGNNISVSIESDYLEEIGEYCSISHYNIRFITAEQYVEGLL